MAKLGQGRRVRIDTRVGKVHHAPEGDWFEVSFHRVRDDGMGQCYQEVGEVGSRMIHVVRLPYPVYKEMGNPTKLTVTVRAGDSHASTLNLWEGE